MDDPLAVVIDIQREKRDAPRSAHYFNFPTWGSSIVGPQATFLSYLCHEVFPSTRFTLMNDYENLPTLIKTYTRLGPPIQSIVVRIGLKSALA